MNFFDLINSGEKGFRGPIGDKGIIGRKGMDGPNGEKGSIGLPGKVSEYLVFYLKRLFFFGLLFIAIS